MSAFTFPKLKEREEERKREQDGRWIEDMTGKAGLESECQIPRVDSASCASVQSAKCITMPNMPASLEIPLENIDRSLTLCLSRVTKKKIR